MEGPFQNVYEALGFSDPPGMQRKAGIAQQIGKFIAANNLSFLDAANIIGIPEPQLADVLRGRFADLSLEQMQAFLQKIERHTNGRAVPRG